MSQANRHNSFQINFDCNIMDPSNFTMRRLSKGNVLNCSHVIIYMYKSDGQLMQGIYNCKYGELICSKIQHVMQILETKSIN